MEHVKKIEVSETEFPLDCDMTLQKVKGNLEHMFDKTLIDIVRGIRVNKDNEVKYVTQCLEEIKEELTHGNISVKTNAIDKLTYLQMLGYDMSWATFNIIEVFSSSKFPNKRVGYLAASQSFHSDTELLMLATNTIRKDINSSNQYESGIALSALSCFINNDLAKNLSTDILALLNSTKPYVRKKALVMVYKLILKDPEILKLAFSRITEKLDDEESCVQTTAMNVMCELANKNPNHYMCISPILYSLLATSTNNWLLIKIIKLLGIMAPLEPRLGCKLIDSLSSLIHSTCAISVLYESINTLIAILDTLPPTMLVHRYNASIQLCTQKIIIFINDSDQNLKYLGMISMSRIMKHHSKLVQSSKDLVIECLNDKDESICYRVLDILQGLVTKKNLPEIVQKLMMHMTNAHGMCYRDQLLNKIISLCTYNNYHYVVNFEWYVGVLVELSHIDGSQYGLLVASQLLDIAVRVSTVRSAVVHQMSNLLAVEEFVMFPVLSAASWICGEFCEHLNDIQLCVRTMSSKRIFILPGNIQAVYIHSMLKQLSSIALNTKDTDKLFNLFHIVLETLSQLIVSGCLEVQERASESHQLILFITKEIRKGNVNIVSDLVLHFQGDLIPVSPTAQQKVAVPPGLDLDKWINEPSANLTEEKVDENIFAIDLPKKKDLSEEELQKLRIVRIEEQAKNPHYLNSCTKNKKVDKELSDIPINEIDLSIPLKVPGTIHSKYFSLRRNADQLPTRSNNTNKKNKIKQTYIKEKHTENAPDIVNTSSKEIYCEMEPSEYHITLSGISAKFLKKKKNKMKKGNRKKPKVKGKHETNLKDVPPEGNLLGDNSDLWLKYGPTGYQTIQTNTSHGDFDIVEFVAPSLSQIGEYQGNLINLIPSAIEEHESSNIVTEYINISQERDAFLNLAEDNIMEMKFKFGISPEENAISVTILYINKGSFLIKELDFIVSETDILKMKREDCSNGSCGVKMAFTVPPYMSQEVTFKFQALNSYQKQKLRGTVTYMVETSDGILSHEKLDFWLLFPCSCFLSPSTTLTSDALEGEYTCHELLDGELQQVTLQVCSKWRFQLVKRTETTSTMKSMSLDGHRIYLDLSNNNGQILMVGKCTSQLFVENLMAEISAGINTQ